MRREELSGVRNAAALVTVSQTHAAEAEELYGFTGMTCTIPNGADPERLWISADERQPRPGHFLYVGSLEAWKGLPLAVDALALVPDAQLHLCGGSPDASEWSALARRADDLAIRSRLHLHGHIPQHELKPWLATAQAGVLPIDGTFSIAERYTCPLKLLEYLMAGLPCIASDLPSVRELVTHDHEALLFAEGDKFALARSMSRLIHEPETARRLSASARVSAENYTWQKRAERVLDVCRDVIAAQTQDVESPVPLRICA